MFLLHSDNIRKLLKHLDKLPLESCLASRIMTGPISALEGFEGVAEFRMTKEIAIESYRKSLYLFFFPKATPKI